MNPMSKELRHPLLNYLGDGRGDPRRTAEALRVGGGEEAGGGSGKISRLDLIGERMWLWAAPPVAAPKRATAQEAQLPKEASTKSAAAEQVTEQGKAWEQAKAAAAATAAERAEAERKADAWLLTKANAWGARVPHTTTRCSPAVAFRGGRTPEAPRRGEAQGVAA